MCTAISYYTDSLYFGRNLDYESSYGESVVITPRKFPLSKTKDHYAMIGIAHVCDGYPLYYDGFNEKGLCIAGLNFTKSAVFGDKKDGFQNVAQYELIPRLLGTCANINEVSQTAETLNITGERFKENMPAARLHWMVADRNGTLVLEQTESGLNVYDDPAGVLTNEPPFLQQMFALNDYMALSPYPPKNSFAENMPLENYSRGMGAVGLPGDLSSKSRFVRAAFMRANSVCDGSDGQSIAQFFHLLGSVEQQRGAVRLDGEKCEITIYSSCMAPESGMYYFKTYNDPSVRSVSMKNTDLDGDSLYICPVTDSLHVTHLN